MARTVDDYIAGLKDGPAAVAAALRHTIRAAAPELAEIVKWGQPVYEADGPVCYFRGSTSHVTFGFWRGAELRALSPRLESSGDVMAHLKLATVAAIDPAEITALLREAIALNRVKGSPTRRG